MAMDVGLLDHIEEEGCGCGLLREERSKGREGAGRRGRIPGSGEREEPGRYPLKQGWWGNR